MRCCGGWASKFRSQVSRFRNWASRLSNWVPWRAQRAATCNPPVTAGPRRFVPLVSKPWQNSVLGFDVLHADSFKQLTAGDRASAFGSRNHARQATAPGAWFENGGAQPKKNVRFAGLRSSGTRPPCSKTGLRTSKTNHRIFNGKSRSLAQCLFFVFFSMLSGFQE